jgi:putative ABC transport system permease protein
MQTVWQDLRYALRMLAKSPGFAAIVVLTLALGIGANTAIFSVVNAVLLSSLPVKHPEELVVVSYTEARSSGPDENFSYPMYRQLRDQNTVLTNLLAHSGLDLNVSYGGRSERAQGELVSGNYFATLGVSPWRGRLFSQDDDRIPGGHPLAVLSYGYWERRFGCDPSVIGQQIILNGKPTTVIGVTPPRFYGAELDRNPDIRVPMMMATVFRPFPANRLENPRHRWLTIMGRRKAGVGSDAAQASMDVLYRQIVQNEVAQLPPTVSAHDKARALETRLKLLPGEQGFAHLQGEMQRPVLLLFCVTGIVLLVACSNLANLLLARTEKRRAEIAVRLAIGAGKARLVRQWLTEALLLSAMGGVAGAAVAVWARMVFLSFLPADTGSNLNLPLDLRVLGFTLLSSLLTGILFGLAPAWQVSRSTVSAALREEGASVASGTNLLSLRSGLVFLQVTLSLPLLIAAGLFLHSLENLNLINTGFVKQNVFIASLNPSLNGYAQERIKSFYGDLLGRIRTVAGVQAASLSSGSPISGSWDEENVRVQGYQSRPDENNSPNAAIVTPGYFACLGISMVAGRDFSDTDAASRPKVAIINERMAHYYFGEQNPIGKKFTTEDDPRAPFDIEIVGVVKDAKYVKLAEEPRRHFYTPMAQESQLFDMTLHVRTSDDPARLKEIVRAQVHDLDSNLPIYGTSTLEIQVDRSLMQQRLVAWMASLFGGVAMLMAALGLYGVIAFTIVRRTREIGIRMALGAQPKDILGVVLRQMLIVVGAGLVVGAVGAFAASRLLVSMLYQVRGTDLFAYGGASLLLLAVAGVAAYFPAQRATQIDPVEALRYE